MSRDNVRRLPLRAIIWVPLEERRGKPDCSCHFYVTLKVPRSVVQGRSGLEKLENIVAVEVDPSSKRGFLDLTLTVVDTTPQKILETLIALLTQSGAPNVRTVWYSGVGAGTKVI